MMNESLSAHASAAAEEAGIAQGWPPVRPAPEGERRDGQPLRDDANIQGNVLAGFNKDHQVLMFVEWPDQASGRAWLTELRPRLATNRAVTAFNAAFSAARAGSGGDPSDLTAVWTNISFTASGILTLAPDALASLAIIPGIALWLGEPWDETATAQVGDTGDSAPDHWLFGRRGQRIHAVVCIAADVPGELAAETARFRDCTARHDVRIVFEQLGETLPGAARGHEHFGFKDGISQPGVWGYDRPDPDRPDEVAGKPGTDLIAAGTFILGYPRDDDSGVPAEIRVPKWMWDGSFLVTRRLSQDVPSFWANVESVYRELVENGVSDQDMSGPDALAAKLVGRWRSGTPTDLAPTVDNEPAPGAAENNDFSFENDHKGINTPFVAHIRKLYQRKGGDQTAVPITEGQTKGRRILRRGIPFGAPFAPGDGHGAGVDAERGLIFQCYQASLADQFAHLQQKFVNDADFPNPATGNDAVIGQESRITLQLSGIAQHPTMDTFVRTQGSLFSFTPALPTVDDLVAGRELREA
ncbi:MAG TPA: hypothetical protein VH373_24250 [Jatrophihabitantaceae bacterium]